MLNKDQMDKLDNAEQLLIKFNSYNEKMLKERVHYFTEGTMSNSKQYYIRNYATLYRILCDLKFIPNK
jgi:hypothetical protein